MELEDEEAEMKELRRSRSSVPSSRDLYIWRAPRGLVEIIDNCDTLHTLPFNINPTHQTRGTPDDAFSRKGRIGNSPER